MTKRVDFDMADAVDALSDIACQPPSILWNWDANTYMHRGVEPFICLEGLDDHSPVLLRLVRRMAPNGDLNEFELANGLMRLHDAFDIFPKTGRPKPKCTSRHVPVWQHTIGE